MGTGPLDGVRVLELGSFIAGPFAGQLLGDLGADVVKVEPPGDGDPMRRWGVCEDGRSLFWPSIARNKRSVAIDLRDARGVDLVRRLAVASDVVVENFRPGRLEAWGLTYASLAAEAPGLVLVRVSGFGQTGPRAADPGFGSVGEAMGGIRHTTGFPDRPPTRTGISLGDSLAALFAVVGCLAALQERSRSGRGQEVDVAIYEAVMALMESSLADLELGGVLRGRSGSVLPGVAPSNVYPTADGHELLIAANADALFARLSGAMGRPELAEDARFATHAGRGVHMEALDAEVASWTSSLPLAEVQARLEAAEVPVGRINTAADLLADPHVSAREMVQRVVASGYTHPVPMTGVVPRLSRTPGRVATAGPALGAHTDEVLAERAGLSPDELADLRAADVIASAVGPGA